MDLVIRIWNDEYDGIPQDGYLTHFVLPPTTVEAGKRYALPRIVRHGYVDLVTRQEVSPELSFDDIYAGTCLSVDDLSYEALAAEDFAHSMRHIKNIADLKRYMLRRYRASRPEYSDANILSRGVSKISLNISK